MIAQLCAVVSAACLVGAQAARAEFPEPVGTLTLGAALDAALQNSPQLAPFRLDRPIAEAYALQAGLRPNPTLTVEVENLAASRAGTATTRTQSVGIAPDGLPSAGLEWEKASGSRGVFDGSEFTLRLSQLVELGGKRAARVVAAELAADVTAWDYEVRRHELVGEVVVRFMDVLAAQERVRQAEVLAGLGERLADTVQGQVEAGAVSPLEGRRARAEAARLEVDIHEARDALDQARMRLAALWGSTRPQFDGAAGDLAALDPLPDLDALLGVRAHHPLLQRWTAELAHRDAVTARERTRRIPDIEVSLGYRLENAGEGVVRRYWLGSDGAGWARSREEGARSHSVVLEVSVPLPIFDRNQGEIRASELLAERGAAERRAVDIGIASELTRLHAAAHAARERVEALASRILPEFEVTYALTQEGYAEGKFDLFAVLDAERSLGATRLALSDARIAYHEAVAEIERTLGAPMSGLSPSTAEPTEE